MNLSIYVSQLLFEHECVIIPGFGGFVCNYKAAEIQSATNRIYPPGKAISFNKNLVTNDGLLVNHMSTQMNITAGEAWTCIYDWVSSTQSLLQKGEVVFLDKVGSFHLDIENNIQFAPAHEVNYLKASYGLPVITAAPVAQATKDVRTIQRHRRPVFRIAAAIVLLIGLSAISGLMWKGVGVDSWNLNEANVFSFLNKLTKSGEPVLTPMPVELNTEAVTGETIAEEVLPEVTTPAFEEISGDRYYVIIGSFRRQSNIDAAKERLLQRFSETEILVEEGNSLTKVGYYAGNNADSAGKVLNEARAEDGSYWLLKK